MAINNYLKKTFIRMLKQKNHFNCLTRERIKCILQIIKGVEEKSKNFVFLEKGRCGESP